MEKSGMVPQGLRTLVRMLQDKTDLVAPDQKQHFGKLAAELRQLMTCRFT